MLALTLVQPWAYAVAHLGKDIENRTWKPPARILGERIAIHAGSKCRSDDVEALRELGYALPQECQQGAIVATVVVVGWVSESDGFSATLTKAEANQALQSPWYHEGHFGWVLRSVRALPRPIRCKGALSLWHAPI
jgi:hypothetical protein